MEYGTWLEMQRDEERMAAAELKRKLEEAVQRYLEGAAPGTAIEGLHVLRGRAAYEAPVRPAVLVTVTALEGDPPGTAVYRWVMEVAAVDRDPGWSEARGEALARILEKRAAALAVINAGEVQVQVEGYAIRAPVRRPQGDVHRAGVVLNGHALLRRAN